jgi:hypothetical protein
VSVFFSLWGLYSTFREAEERVTQENFAKKTEILDFAKSRHYSVKPFILLGFLQ